MAEVDSSIAVIFSVADLSGDEGIRLCLKRWLAKKVDLSGILGVELLRSLFFWLSTLLCSNGFDHLTFYQCYYSIWRILKY